MKYRSESSNQFEAFVAKHGYVHAGGAHAFDSFAVIGLMPKARFIGKVASD